MDIETLMKVKELIFNCQHLSNDQAVELYNDVEQSVMDSDIKRTIRKGEVLKLKYKGRVKFDGLDTYFGETTARFIGLDYPGTHYEKLERLDEQGITVIDN